MKSEYLNLETIDKLKAYMRKMQIPAYKLSSSVFNKSSSYLSFKLNSQTITESDLNKILNYLKISINDLN